VLDHFKLVMFAIAEVTDVRQRVLGSR